MVLPSGRTWETVFSDVLIKGVNVLVNSTCSVFGEMMICLLSEFSGCCNCLRNPSEVASVIVRPAFEAATIGDFRMIGLLFGNNVAGSTEETTPSRLRISTLLGPA